MLLTWNIQGLNFVVIELLTPISYYNNLNSSIAFRHCRSLLLGSI